MMPLLSCYQIHHLVCRIRGSMDSIHIWIGSTSDPSWKCIPCRRKHILVPWNESCEKSNNSWNFQTDPATSSASMTHWSPPKNYFLMKKLKIPKHLMSKSINPISAQGLIYPYVKICSWTLTCQYQGLLSTFLFDISLWSRSSVKGWSILMYYVVAHFTYTVL